MNRKKTAIFGVIAFICGAISFFSARSTAINKKELEQSQSRQWLSNASDAAVALEDKINEEMTGLIANLVDKQASLGSVLDDPSSPDDAVLEHAENFIAAHEHLMRRAGEHVVELRGKLPEGSRRHLMGLCAETVRGPIYRMGGPGGRHNGAGGGMGPGYRRHGGGPGAGRGRGMHRGVCKRLANCLGLDEGQANLLHEKDPGFETETVNLRSVLLDERATLLSMFEHPTSTDDQLRLQIEKLIAAHSGIERRIIRHILVLRPHLSIEQQKWLIGLCRRTQDDSLPL